MARQPTGKPNGRPVREFDQKTFEGLCNIWCTIQEIQTIFRTDISTIDKWCQRTYGDSFSDTYKRLSDYGKASLRRNQLALSKTNAAMAIWLGKQKLGQKDNPDSLEQFNGKLAELLDMLKAPRGINDFHSGSQSSTA